MYALAASKHAPHHPSDGQRPTQTQTAVQKMTPKARPTNIITLIHETGSDITHPCLSNAKLIQELNLVFRQCQIKLKPEDKKAKEIKSVRRHLSNDTDL